MKQFTNTKLFSMLVLYKYFISLITFSQVFYMFIKVLRSKIGTSVIDRILLIYKEL